MIDDNRRKRINRLKKMILWTVALLIIIPTVLSIILAVRVFALKRQLVRSEEQRLSVEAAYNNLLSGSDVTEQEPVDDPTHNSEEWTSEVDSIRFWEESQTENTEVKAAELRKVYLTFDDGPSVYTDRILDTLAQYGVKATFFVVAEGKEDYEDQLRRIVAEGHTLAMHSYSHKYREIYASKEAFIKDVNRLQDYLYDVTGVHPSIYRFPGGSSNRTSKVDMRELEAYLAELGIQYFDWNISSRDATGNGISSAQIVRNCTLPIKKYEEAVILLHDSGAKRSTVEALPELIETILAMEDTVMMPITEDTVPIHHG